MVSCQTGVMSHCVTLCYVREESHWVMLHPPDVTPRDVKVAVDNVDAAMDESCGRVSCTHPGEVLCVVIVSVQPPHLADTDTDRGETGRGRDRE